MFSMDCTYEACGLRFSFFWVGVELTSRLLEGVFRLVD